MRAAELMNEHRFLMEHEGAEILQKFNLPVIESVLTETEEQAVLMAEKIGYPVVLKGMSREITHKQKPALSKLILVMKRS